MDENGPHTEDPDEEPLDHIGPEVPDPWDDDWQIHTDGPVD